MTKRKCQHSYKLEMPSGMRTRGVCKRCGLVRTFPSSWIDAVPVGRMRVMGRYRNQEAKVEASI